MVYIQRHSVGRGFQEPLEQVSKRPGRIAREPMDGSLTNLPGLWRHGMEQAPFEFLHWLLSLYCITILDFIFKAFTTLLWPIT